MIVTFHRVESGQPVLSVEPPAHSAADGGQLLGFGPYLYGPSSVFPRPQLEGDTPSPLFPGPSLSLGRPLLVHEPGLTARRFGKGSLLSVLYLCSPDRTGGQFLGSWASEGDGVPRPEPW